MFEELFLRGEMLRKKLCEVDWRERNGYAVNELSG